MHSGKARGIFHFAILVTMDGDKALKNYDFQIAGLK
jgi:hypothetical protein